MTYWQKLKDPRWQQKRLRVMERDNFTCRDCADTKKNQQVHHCFYEKGDPWDTGDEFLLTLCDECHENRGALESDGKRMLAQIFVGMDAANLRFFVESLACNVSSGSEARVCNIFDHQYKEDFRWYSFACNNKYARRVYEAVTGNKCDWKAIDTKK